MQQLPLTISQPPKKRFDNFIGGEANAMAVSSLKNLVNSSVSGVIGLQGVSGSGKTHLLEAACFAGLSQRCVYIPLQQCICWSPLAVLEDLHLQQFVCIDDLDAVFSSPEWQQQMFHFYNRLLDSGGRLIFSSQTNLATVTGVLPDLLSRLKMGLNFTLQPLSGDACETVLLQRAEEYGISLSEEVVRYIMNHTEREISALILLLEQLDRLSLVEKRKPSIRLVKRLLEAGS